MNQFELFQLATSFVIGGIIIAVQSIAAEKFPKLGGYIVSLPSTLPLSLFFIGWIGGIDDAKFANHAVPYSIINLVIFSISFILISRIVHKLRIVNITSLFTWVILAMATEALFLETDYVSSIYVCIIFLSLAAFGFHALPHYNTDKGVGDKDKNLSVISRGLIAGSIILTSSLLAKFMSPFWGGIFAVFPAAYISNFNFIISSSGYEVLRNVIVRVPQGSFLFLIFSFFFWIISNDSILVLLMLSYILTLLIGLPLIAVFRHSERIVEQSQET